MNTPSPEASGYRMEHWDRLVTTVAAIPPPCSLASALELGCYMQVTPAVVDLCGYRSIRGAYFGPASGAETATTSVGNRTFQCVIDKFDAETDPFPYRDGEFDLVLACEVLEHFRSDPMHCLTECNRILCANGVLLLTTPNCSSLTSIARVLGRKENPYIFSQYAAGNGGDPRSKHVREYTPDELESALGAAGFAIDCTFTRRIRGLGPSEWVPGLLEQSGFPTALRGEQLFCIARKQEGQTIERYPDFLYK